jgi:hypothetical protein
MIKIQINHVPETEAFPTILNHRASLWLHQLSFPSHELSKTPILMA